jgi:hypothetical protein
MPYTNLPVITRDQLQNLKAELASRPEEARIPLLDCERIESIVDRIYKTTIDIAENTDERESMNKVYSEYDPFYRKYIVEIIKGLKSRLPDCSIEQKQMVHGTDGRLYESNNPLYGPGPKTHYIVISWS